MIIGGTVSLRANIHAKDDYAYLKIDNFTSLINKLMGKSEWGIQINSDKNLNSLKKIVSDHNDKFSEKLEIYCIIHYDNKLYACIGNLGGREQTTEFIKNHSDFDFAEFYEPFNKPTWWNDCQDYIWKSNTDKLVASPSEDLPKVASPSEDLPKVASPSEDLPKVASPREDLPKVASPREDLPKVASPREDLPKVASPREDLPPFNELILTMALKTFFNNNLTLGKCYGSKGHAFTQYNGTLIYQDGTACSASCAFSDVFVKSDGTYVVQTNVNSYEMGGNTGIDCLNRNTGIDCLNSNTGIDCLNRNTGIIGDTGRYYYTYLDGNTGIIGNTGKNGDIGIIGSTGINIDSNTGVTGSTGIDTNTIIKCITNNAKNQYITKECSNLWNVFIELVSFSGHDSNTCGHMFLEYIREKHSIIVNFDDFKTRKPFYKLLKKIVNDISYQQDVKYDPKFHEILINFVSKKY